MDRSKLMSDPPLIERDRELSTLLQCASARTPVLLIGSPGLGRTRLLRELGARLTAESIGSVYVPFVQPLHAFLVSMATRLALRTVNGSSVALRGLLLKALEDHPRILLLDDIERATLPSYRFFERVLYVGASRWSAQQFMHMESVLLNAYFGTVSRSCRYAR